MAKRKKKLKKYQAAGSNTPTYTTVDPEGTQSNAPYSELFGKGLSGIGITAAIGRALKGVSEKMKEKKKLKEEQKYNVPADPKTKEGYDPYVNRNGGSLMNKVSDLSIEAENTLNGKAKNKKLGMPLPKKNMGGRTNGSRTSYE